VKGTSLSGNLYAIPSRLSSLVWAANKKNFQIARLDPDIEMSADFDCAVRVPFQINPQ
jgi:hypothetical protein